MNNLGFGTATESPWRAGANENTVIQFEDPVMVEGKPIAAGTYGLHMIIHDNNRATVIFSNNHTAWGSYFYDPAEDVLRVDVETKEIPHTELLTFLFDTVDANSATASLNWEKKQIPFRISVDVTGIVLADIRNKLQDAPGFSRQTWEQAANYSLNNGGDLDEALGWINAAIEGQFFSQKTFGNLQTKSQILDKMGKKAEATAVMEEAMPLGTILEVHQYGRQLIGQGQTAEALEVFKWNAKNHKNTWPVDYGLARGYSATGDYKAALKHLKIAEGRAPDEVNKAAIATNLEKLGKGEDIN
jgi:tetratricopeptide (TPR) repeat protein